MKVTEAGARFEGNGSLLSYDHDTTHVEVIRRSAESISKVRLIDLRVDRDGSIT